MKLRRHPVRLATALLAAAACLGAGLVATAPAAAAGSIDVSTFGAVPNDGVDDANAIQNAINYAKANSISVINLAAGTFDLVAAPSTSTAWSMTAHLYFKDMQNVTLQGSVDGSGNPSTKLVRRLNATNGTPLADARIMIETSDGIAIKNLIMDSNPKTVATGQITAVSANQLTLDIYSTSARLIPASPGKTAITYTDTVNPQGFSTEYVQDGGTIANISGGSGRLQTFTANGIGSAHSKIAVGNNFSYTITGGGGYDKYTMLSKNITFENIRDLSTVGLNNRAFGTDNLTYEKYVIKPESVTLPVVSSRDGLNFCAVGGSVTINNSYLTATLDDTLAFGGANGVVEQRISNTSILMNWGNLIDFPGPKSIGPVPVGSRVGFWTTDQDDIGFKATVTSYSYNNSTDKVTLTFAESLPSWVQPNIITTPFARQFSSFHMTNTAILKGSMRVLDAKDDVSVPYEVNNNTFYYTGVDLSGFLKPNTWLGSMNKGWYYHHNNFWHSNFTVRAWPSMTDNPNMKGNSDITFKNNELTRSVIDIQNTKNSTFTNNIFHNTWMGPVDPANTSNVVQSPNTIDYTDPAFAFAPPTSTPAPTNPVSLWSFNENSGTTAGDTYGGNSGTVTAGSWVTGRSGSALSFNGTTSYVNIGTPSSLGFTGNITVAAWVKPTSVGSESVIVGKAWDGSTTPFWLSLLNGTTARFGHYQGGLTVADGTSPTSLTDGNWHHVAGVYDGTAYKTYIDGVLRATTTSGQGVSAGTGNIQIGRIDEPTKKYFAGGIDQVRIYNTALSAADISGLYSAGN
ncbi:LamG-like jellyroll fold domain-containing protein [Microbacterium sp. NPDC057407]|uniref:LamG-like jellyroll fold domain-containing protein n=1 Tax=Microbacterium sp. NPDC057407 TaxID=3346120 RepID=UPI003670ADEF